LQNTVKIKLESKSGQRRSMCADHGRPKTTSRKAAKALSYLYLSLGLSVFAREFNHSSKCSDFKAMFEIMTWPWKSKYLQQMELAKTHGGG